jgi:tetratricopeptide (TPR) repeat protein
MNDYKNNIQIQHKLQAAENLEAEGKLLHATQIYNALINEYPDLFEAYFKLASIYELMDNKEAGLNLLNEFLNEHTEDKTVRLAVGQFLFRNAKWDETIEILSYFLPDEEPLVSFFIGYSHFMLKEFELAKISFENYIRFTKDSTFTQDAYLFLAKTHINLHNYDNALTYLKYAEQYFAGQYELHLLYAVVYFYLNMETNAVSSIERSLKLNPKEPSVLEWAGKIFLKEGDYKKAEFFYNQLLALSEMPSCEVYLNLGIACLNTKKIPEAQNYFDLALKLEPHNKAVIEALKNIESFKQQGAVSND